MWLVVAVQTAHRSVSNVISITWIESPEGCFRLFHSVCYKSGISFRSKNNSDPVVTYVVVHATFKIMTFMLIFSLSVCTLYPGEAQQFCEQSFLVLNYLFVIFILNTVVW